MSKERAGLGLDEEDIDLAGVLNMPPPPLPTPAQKKKAKEEGEKLGFVSRQHKNSEAEIKPARQAINLLINKDLHKAFKLKTLQNDVAMTEVIEHWIKDYVDK